MILKILIDFESKIWDSMMNAMFINKILPSSKQDGPQDTIQFNRGWGEFAKIHSSLEVILNLEKTQIPASDNVTEPIFENQYISKVLLATAIATGYEAPAYIAWSSA